MTDEITYPALSDAPEIGIDAGAADVPGVIRLDYEYPIPDITIGDRHRRDLGDINGFASNIAEVGLLHPIVVRPDGLLIAGLRRLAACKKLGWQSIRVSVVDLEQITRGEFAENAYRKDFLPSEIYEIWRALEPIERAA